MVGANPILHFNLIIRQIAITVICLFYLPDSQTVRQRTLNPLFVGSSPAPAANIAVWSSRSARSIFNREAVGSNPTTAPTLKPSVMAK